MKKLKSIGVIAAITAKSSEKAIEYISACVKGGIQGIEINYATPNINEVVKKVKVNYPDLLIGVAEIPDTLVAQELIELGVNYVTTPYSDYRIEMACQNIKGLTYIPGCMTLSEIKQEKDKGNNIIKLYPAEILNPKYISIINSIMKFVDVMPAGGINIDNIDQWFENGAYCVVVGRYLIEKDDSEEIEKRAKALIDKYNKLKLNK
ncbi:hypothetical protein [Romboutsia sp.]|uniref:hypothetical protein n=1 Tax=Romboutsia sp. TaxID=1965302 RepID=UPI003F30DBD3